MFRNITNLKKKHHQYKHVYILLKQGGGEGGDSARKGIDRV